MHTALNTKALALAGAGVGAIVLALCFALYAVAGRPDPWMQLFLGTGPTLGGWLVGIAEAALVGGLTGALVGFFYNRFAKPATAAR